MRTIQKTYALFEELNAEAKEKAIEENRNINTDHAEWWEYTCDDAKAVGKLMGLDIEQIYFRGFFSQGDGACFECSFEYVKGMVDAVKAHAPLDTDLHQIAEDMQALHAKSFYSTRGTTEQYGHYSHEYSMRFEIGYEYGAENYEKWKEIMADFARWIYARLRSEYEFLTSDECVVESIAFNELEFEID